MPVVTCFIGAVQKKPAQAGRVVYDVFGHVDPVMPWSHIFTTDKPLVAALCKRAAETRRALIIGSKDTRWGQEIVTCELVEQERAS